MNERLKILCELYNRSDENVKVDSLLKVCFLRDFDEALYLISKKQCVKFCYLCASFYVDSYYKYIDEKSKETLRLIEIWINNPTDINRTNAFCNERCKNILIDYAAFSLGQYCYIYTNRLYNECLYLARYGDIEQYRYKILGFLVQSLKED